MYIKKIKHMISNLTGFFQYHYANTKNHYTCRLLGEKYKDNHVVISFRNLGESHTTEISIQELLSTPFLIANFHPKEALIIGSIALEEFTLGLSKNDQKEEFYKIKNIMLNSIHDITRSIKDSYLEESFLINQKKSIKTSFIRQHPKNKYPFKLVGGKSSDQINGTVITYTILGKREGHEKDLREIINNSELLEKFHPTEVVKFGFISLGDSIFSNEC